MNDIRTRDIGDIVASKHENIELEIGDLKSLVREEFCLRGDQLVIRDGYDERFVTQALQYLLGSKEYHLRYFDRIGVSEWPAERVTHQLRIMCDYVESYSLYVDGERLAAIRLGITKTETARLEYPEKNTDSFRSSGVLFAN